MLQLWIVLVATLVSLIATLDIATLDCNFGRHSSRLRDKNILEHAKLATKLNFCCLLISVSTQKRRDHDMSLPLLPGNSFSKTLGEEKFNKVRALHDFSACIAHRLPI